MAHEVAWQYESRAEKDDAATSDYLRISVEWYRRASQLWKQLETVKQIWEAQQRLGCVLMKLGDTENALAVLAANLADAVSREDPAAQARSAAAIAEAYLEQKDVLKAREYAARSLTLFDELGMTEDSARVRELIQRMDCAA